MTAAGRFITFEGGEGAGKSTQARRLAEALRALGHRVLLTREPGGSAGAEAIRRLLVEGDADRWDPTTEALLHSAARRDHVRRAIRPALERGEWVVSDRYADSTIAYQGFGLGVDREVLARLQAIATDGLQPDLTVILDLPVDLGLARAESRTGAPARYERMEVEMHHRLRRGFLSIAAEEPERCVVVDADRPEEALAGDVLALVQARLA